MQPVHPYRPNVFSGSPLDRIGAIRKDEAQVSARLAHPSTVVLPVWRARNLIVGDAPAPSPGALLPDLAQALLSSHPWALLGEHAGRTLVAVDLSSLDAPIPPNHPGRFEDLRRAGGMLTPADAAILAYARGLMHWRTRTRFCSVCGASCVAGSAGHVMACTGCGVTHFPRSDPAVIMLVVHQDRALLGQPARFRDVPLFTTLAGFVEPGESLEEAVAREVNEEAGVRVGNVRYRSSQPWPFPASLMLGFTAEAEDDVLTIDTEELVQARWFTRDELRARSGIVLPPDLSIARRLIDEWVDLSP